MKLLIDQDIAGSTAALLRALGHDAASASELGMSTSDDTLIVQAALMQHRVIATLDHDYHQILATKALEKPQSFSFGSKRLQRRSQVS